MAVQAQLDLFSDLSQETQLNLFSDLKPHLPREIPLDIHFSTREQVGYSLNYTRFWTQYREQAALDRVDDLTADFADFCALKKKNEGQLWV